MKNFIDILLKLATDWDKRYEDRFQPKVEEIAKSKKYPFDFVFKNGNRIVIPFESTSIVVSEDDKDIMNVLENNGYNVDWKNGTASKPYVSDKGKSLRTVKIPKALKEIYKEKISLQSVQVRLDGLLRNYEKSLSRAFLKNPKPLNIIVSQNPHDIAKMSYGRRWTSCMNLEKGEYKPIESQEEDRVDVLAEVESGGLIAYVVMTNDQEIKNPLSRILIKRFQNELGDSYLMPETRIYGLPFTNFVETVYNWLKQNGLDKPSKQLSLFYQPVYRMKGTPYTDTLKEFDVPEEMFQNITYDKVMFNSPEDREAIVTRLVENYPEHPLIEEIIEKSDDPNLLFVIAAHVGKDYGPLFLSNDNFWTDNIKFWRVRHYVMTVIAAKFLPYFLEYEENGKMLAHIINRLFEYQLSNKVIEMIAKRSSDVDPTMVSRNMNWDKLPKSQLELLYNKSGSYLFKESIKDFLQSSQL